MTTTQNTPTTLSVFAGKRASNYSSMPTIDVEILSGPRLCGSKGCDLPVHYDQTMKPWGAWVHTEDLFAADHAAIPRRACCYCGTQDPVDVTFVQASWSDETRCTRCGGVDGFAIGD